MRKRLALSILLFLLLLPLLACTGAGADRQLPLDAIRLPEGFRIKLYATDVPGARSMALSPSGTLFVGTRGEGKVYAVTARRGSTRADRVVTVATGLEMPNGVAFRDGALYVAEVSRVLRFDAIESRLENSGRPAVVNDSFPKDRHHGWKFIRFGPDGMLYVPVGAPCNICESDDSRYAAIHRMNPDGTGLALFASGIRNTVGFDWDPATGDLWFTDNGRDWLGDDSPPDELNRAPAPGLHFGYPYIHGNGIPDPEFGKRGAGRRFIPPVAELGAHVAALGMRFYTGSQFPSRYRGAIFIAEHGSWNRSVPSGYRVVALFPGTGGVPKQEVFAEGWLRDGKAWGRPVDVLVMPDGALLVSDDKAGAIYRISFER
ncbi:MAG TPA: PQQ-dependent sugar dehydrogenase [Candidatus Deferrimicrobiaceae bacterium]